MADATVRNSVLTLLLCLLISLPCPAQGDERRIRASVKLFLETSDVDRRTELVRLIESDPAYNRAKVSDYLHGAGLFDNLEPGRQVLTVKLPTKRFRFVTIRVPNGYSPTHPYPLIYALHCGGCTTDWIIPYVENILGDNVEQCVIAATQSYGAPDFEPHELPAVLRAVKKLAHIDSDRVYVTGYSAGGCASWAHAVLQPDVFAAVIPVAGSLFIGEQTDAFLQNIANTYVLNVWGAKDTAPGWDADTSGIAASNRRLQARVERLGLPVDSYEYPRMGHMGIRPPPDLLASALRRKRKKYPRQVDHVFQHACQARAYWLERRTGQGEVWPNHPAPTEQHPGENPNRAIERALRQQQAEFHGKIEGQTITVTAEEKAGELIIWFGDETIDWRRDVRVILNGVVAFEDRMIPDPFVCMAQASRTYDFDRLRWAGLIVRTGAPTVPVTATTEFFDPQPGK